MGDDHSVITGHLLITEYSRDSIGNAFTFADAGELIFTCDIDNDVRYGAGANRWGPRHEGLQKQRSVIGSMWTHAATDALVPNYKLEERRSLLGLILVTLFTEHNFFPFPEDYLDQEDDLLSLHSFLHR